MTLPLFTDIGEEYLVTSNPDGATVTFTLYQDGTDGLTELADLGDITTEPDGAAYARQSSTVSVGQLSGAGGGDYGFQTDSQVQFDTSDSTRAVDAVGYIVTFASEVAGDGGAASDHLIGGAELSSTYQLSDYDTVTYEAGDLELPVT